MVTGPVRNAIFYYGTGLPPNVAWAAALRDTAVVLQPYHPLLTGGAFADYFPHCSLYMYWNPTGAPARDLAQAGQQVEVLGADPVWHIPRLDLHSAPTREFAVRRGLHALQAGGGAVSGLFVDDLDRWSRGQRQDAALATVAALLARAGRAVALFVNRAFPLWPRLDPITAVLLEELTPGLVDRMSAQDRAWVERCVLPATRRVRQRGAAVFGLTYEPAPEQQPRRAVSAHLATLVDGIAHGCRSLDTWPEESR
jgi:hypothetical protein